MNCPECDKEQSEENTECERCGIIFAKYYSLLNSEKKVITLSDSMPKSGKSSSAAGRLLFYVKPDQNMVIFYGKLLVLSGIVIWGFRFMNSPLQGNYAMRSFMHLVNLPFHEAGHVFSRPLGPFMTSLGGTIGQLLMPLICSSVLLVKTRDPFGASVALWWFGQNFFDIAPYINDARSLSLPLLGGNSGDSAPYGFHDWHYLLTEAGLLQHDHLIAKLAIAMGVLTFIVSYSWCSILLFKQFKKDSKPKPY